MNSDIRAVFIALIVVIVIFAIGLSVIFCSKPLDYVK
jgi:hypothetical protein